MLALLATSCSSDGGAVTTSSAPAVTTSTSTTTTSTTTTSTTSTTSSTTTTTSSTTTTLADVAVGTEWASTDAHCPVYIGCCGENSSGRPSPPLPPSWGPFPYNGAYAFGMTRNPDWAGPLTVTLYRWVSCADNPNGCSPDVLEGDITVDDSTSVDRTIALGDLTVVLSGIAVPVTENMRAPMRITADGTTFAQLLEEVDRAYEEWVREPIAQGESPEEVYERLWNDGVADPAVPFVPVPDDSVLAYRGPLGALLLVYIWAGDGDFYPASAWSSECLEIVGGAPVLYLDAGRVAG